MGFLEYIASDPEGFFEMALDHTMYVLMAVAMSAVIGVTVGILVHRRDALAAIVTAICATILTIPSFALFGLTAAWLGLGNAPAVAGLVLYGLLPIVRNTITGLRGVDEAILESATGMGMNPRQRLLKVQLPLAWPIILAGLRVSTMLVVSIFAIAALLNADGLGEPITTALANLGASWALDHALAGTLGIVLVAVVLDLFYQAFGRLTTSRGIR